MRSSRTTPSPEPARRPVQGGRAGASGLARIRQAYSGPLPAPSPGDALHLSGTATVDCPAPGNPSTTTTAPACASSSPAAVVVRPRLALGADPGLTNWETRHWPCRWAPGHEQAGRPRQHREQVDVDDRLQRAGQPASR